MKNMMAIVIIAVVYALYLLLGVYRQFPVGYVDWVKPFGHYDVLAGREAINGFVLPLIVFGLAGLGWYKKSMIGEA